jgi:PQQ-like domain
VSPEYSLYRSRTGGGASREFTYIRYPAKAERQTYRRHLLTESSLRAWGLIRAPCGAARRPAIAGRPAARQAPSTRRSGPDRAFGTAGAPGAGSPFFGARLLIADRGNNRLLLLDPASHVVWKYPSAAAPRDPLQFYFPDDAFFADHGTAIISNQEENETIVKLAYPSGKVIWSYGHPRQAGTAPGYLNNPDDAYLLKNGQITVADAMNCRVLVINENRTVAHQIGTDGVCVHNPPTSMGSPNGDTPLSDGNLLISEINGSWVSEYTPAGKPVWTVQLPVIGYPSDPQQLGPDRYLIADYSSPGQIAEFNRQGRVSYRYDPASGPGMLNHPSLAELLPSGVLMANDDYNDRMVAIDPATGALVWQYGITGSTPTHPATG